MDSRRVRRLSERLKILYGERGGEVARELSSKLDRFESSTDLPDVGVGDERDVVLICYGDQIRSKGDVPLATLRRFLLDHELNSLFNTVHLLPFYPYSSDDGFSVIDYRQVDPALGRWHDIQTLGNSFRLMFDLVLNHVSQQSDWFQEYLKGQAPQDRYFIEVGAAADVSNVTRPRSHPLLTEFKTSRGPRRVWTTFSADQVDLNYAEPRVLLEMIDVLLEYIDRGASIVRLDAVAYLWKRLGTNCIHLPETHAVVKLLRDVLAVASPRTLVLTETNVPHAENVSYFGDGDEAQMVYQFSLPPLILDAVLNQDAQVFARWLSELEQPPDGTTFFNFTASHDGIGVRPLEGLVAPSRLNALVEWTRTQGGHVSARRQLDGSESPYELNVTYVDALADPNDDVRRHARRFLASQAIMLALRGMPGVYIHSLLGTQNDTDSVQQSGQPRRINRRKFERRSLDGMLQNPGSLQQRIFRGYQHLLAQRISQPAFHPEADQQVEAIADPRVLAFRRTALDRSSSVFVAWNVSDHVIEMELPSCSVGSWRRDLIGGTRVERTLRLRPYQVGWIEGRH